MPATSPRPALFPAIPLQDCACAAILAFCAMQGSIPFIAPTEALERSNIPGSALTHWGGILSQLAVYAAICAFLLADYRRILRWLGMMRWTAALACLVVASSLWSQFPLLTLRRSIPFAMAALFGLSLAIKFPVRRQLSILTAAMIALALATIVLALFFPRIGLDDSFGHHTDWQGAFTSKNACGRIMVLATAAALSRPGGWLGKTLCVALFVFVTVMSGSRGAWLIEGIVLAIYCGLLCAMRVDRRARVLLLLSAAAVILAGALFAITHIALISASLGRDATLSGRTQIWKQVWPFIQRRPLLGWGYAGFWRGIQGESFRVAAAMRFIVFHAHNGFLEIWLELGAAGLLLFAAGYLRAWIKLWPRLCSGPVERVAWMLFVLVLIGLYDLDENTLLIYNGLFWIVYVAALADIELLAVEDCLLPDFARILAASDHADRVHPRRISSVTL
jgi:O-antigen ligase